MKSSSETFKLFITPPIKNINKVSEPLKEQILKDDVHTIDEMRAWLKHLGYSDTINEAAINFVLREFVMSNYSGNETVNAGTGKELTIKALTELVAKVVGYEGEIKWDTTRPNGTPRKLLDVSKATKLGWKYRTELEDGIRLDYEDFLNNPMRAER